jgi:hypothetical protein
MLNSFLKNKLIAILFLFSNYTFCQFYSGGDISIYCNAYGIHEESNCMSVGFLSYDVTISNSQIGDIFEFNNPGVWGSNIYTATNTTGNSTWNFTINDYNEVYPDQWLNNQPGIAYIYWGERKAILTHSSSPQSSQDTIHNILPFAGVTVTNPCTYQTASGKVYFDENQDCNFDAGDTPLNGLYITSNSNVWSQGNYSNSSGDYSVTIQETGMTSYQVKLPNLYQFIFQSTACSPVYYDETVLPQTGLDFSLQCDDIDLYAKGNGPIRALPGTAIHLNASVGNVGCTPTSGQLKLKLDSRVTYSAANSMNPAESIVTGSDGDTLYWNFTNLSSLSNGAYWNAFISRIQVTPSTSVNIGDTLHFSYWTDIPSNDVNISNNQGTFDILIVAAYDPNYKTVEPAGITEKGYIPSSTSDLTYTIHFQNSGTAAATNIYVIDTLDANIDPSSLHIELTSHALSPEWLAPNVVKFKFNNINLPHEAANEPGSHGQFTYNVRLLNGLELGTEINNRAFIYFDWNAPIITEYATSTLAEKPLVNTDAVSSLTLSDVILNGTFISEEGAPLLEKGFCYGTTTNPDLTNSVIINTDVNNNFYNQLTDLQEETTYYIRTYATNAMGTTYGDEVSFQTGSSAGLVSLMNEMKVYPNPAQNMLYVQSKQLLTNYTIYSMEGKLIQNANFNPNQKHISIETLISGNYILEVEAYQGFKSRILFTKK